MTLWSEFLTNQGRFINKWTHYFPIYEAHFARYVSRPVTFIEIGCGEGGSLQLWKRYLGPFAQIVGLDINPRSTDYEEDQIAVRIGDQKDPEFLAKVLEEFGGGVGREGSFIELCKSLIDELNADHARNQVPVTDFTKSTLSMHFYDSVVVFERGRHIKKKPEYIGMSFRKFWKNAIPNSLKT